MMPNKSESTKPKSQTTSSLVMTGVSQQRTRGSKFLFQANTSESMKPESQTISSGLATGVSQQRTRGSKFLFQELFRKKEENQLKDINKETSELGLVNASLQANKVHNYDGDKGSSPKYVSALSNIDRKSPKGIAIIKSNSGLVKIRPPINAADISFDVAKFGSKYEKENVKRKNFSKEQEKNYKGRKRKSDTDEVVKESKDLKGKNKSKKCKPQTIVLQDSNSSNSSVESGNNIVTKINDVYMHKDEFSQTGSTTQEIFQNKDYKGKGSPKSNPSKDPGNEKESQELVNNDSNRFKIFTPSSSPETVEISSESDNEYDKCNREKIKVVIEETVIQPMILAEDSFQSIKKDNTSDSFDYVHKGVMTQLINKDKSPVIESKRTKRIKNTGISKKPKNTFLVKKAEEKCISTELAGEKDQEKQIKENEHAVQTRKAEREIASNIYQNVCGAQSNLEKQVKENENRIQTKKIHKNRIEREIRSDLVMTPKCGSRCSFSEISPCSDTETSPFLLSQPSQLMQTPRSKTLFTKLSLSQKRKLSNSHQPSNTGLDSTPLEILKSNMKSHLSKITSDTSVFESIGSEHMLSSSIKKDNNLIINESVKHKTHMSSHSNALESIYSIVESSSSSIVNAKDDSTCENPVSVNVAAAINAIADPHVSTISYDLFEPKFTSTQHHNKIHRKRSYIQMEKKSQYESVLQTTSIASKSNNSGEPEVITIKTSSESSSNNSISSSLKQVSTEKANNSEGSAPSYASSDSTEMLKPVGRSCLSGIMMVLEQFFGGTMEECLKILQKNSFNILTTIQELQELYPEAAEMINEDTINDE